ncbi:transposase family protein [Methyloprofundus sedimenti]
MEEFGETKKDRFKKLLELEYEIPSHDTFGDVIAVVDSEEFL